MRITYDEETDAVYIRLVDGEYECRTVMLADEISLDFGPNELLVGIEITDAQRILGHGQLPNVDHLPVAAA